MVNVEISTPAPFFQAHELVRRGAWRPITRLAANKQLVDGASHGVSIDGRLALVLGFYPVGDGVEELTMWSGPPAEISPHAQRLFRTGRLIIARRLHSGTTGIIAYVGPGGSPGARLCALLGFTRLEPGPLELWGFAA